MRSLRIGSRGSRLALWQAETVKKSLSVPAEIQVIRTSGDRIQDRALQNQTATGFFTREIEDRLLDGTVDVAVHSLKDLPTELVQELELAAFLPRAAVSDLLIIHPDWHDPDERLGLKPGCRVGTGALRRQAQLAHYAARTRAELLRGNVPTRVERCRLGDYGAIILARAGVERLGLDLEDLVAYELTPRAWLPAPGQGIVAVQCRRDDHAAIAALNQLDHHPSRVAATIERALLQAFEAGCHSAFAAYARHDTDGWSVRVGWEDRGTWRVSGMAGSAEELAGVERSVITAMAVSGGTESPLRGRYPS